TLDDLFGNSRIMRRSRSGRNHDVRGLHRLDFFEGYSVVSKHAQIVAHLAEILHEVIGEGVVVIDNDNHSSNPRCASCIALSNAGVLVTVSMYSPSGRESATMPPPAWMYPLFPFTTSVRIAMHESRLLLKSRYMIAPE